MLEIAQPDQLPKVGSTLLLKPLPPLTNWPAAPALLLNEPEARPRSSKVETEAARPHAGMPRARARISIYDRFMERSLSSRCRASLRDGDLRSERLIDDLLE